jgi:hypothetical protein
VRDRPDEQQRDRDRQQPPGVHAVVRGQPRAGERLALLGALLGTTAAYLAVIAWAHSSLGTTLSPVPVGDLTAVLIGLPLAATISGWLLAGREPPVIARQPLE